MYRIIIMVLLVLSCTNKHYLNHGEEYIHQKAKEKLMVRYSISKNAELYIDSTFTLGNQLVNRFVCEQYMHHRLHIFIVADSLNNVYDLENRADLINLSARFLNLIDSGDVRRYVDFYYSSWFMDKNSYCEVDSIKYLIGWFVDDVSEFLKLITGMCHVTPEQQTLLCKSIPQITESNLIMGDSENIFSGYFVNIAPSTTELLFVSVSINRHGVIKRQNVKYILDIESVLGKIHYKVNY